MRSTEKINISASDKEYNIQIRPITLLHHTIFLVYVAVITKLYNDVICQRVVQIVQYTTLFVALLIWILALKSITRGKVIKNYIFYAKIFLLYKRISR